MPLPPWTPELLTLDLLLSVAEQGSVGRAAAAHGISQPSASARLARLERRLGIALLIRGARGSTLTPAGEAVAGWARDVITAAQALDDGILALRTAGDAKLRVAASLTIAEYLLPQWLLQLRSRHAGVDIAVSVAVANSEQVCARVRDGRADLGLVEMPEVPDDLTARRIGVDRVTLAVAARYPLAARAAHGLRPADLVELPLLLREPGSGTRDTFTGALARALQVEQPSLPHAQELGSTTTLVATARAGGGVAVVSARAIAADLAAGSLVELTVTGLDLNRDLTAVWTGSVASALAGELIALAGAPPPTG